MLVTERAAGLLDLDGVMGSERYSVHSVSAAHPAAELGREIEREVFAETFGNTRAQLEGEYGAYDDASVFLLAVDRHLQEVVGTMRIIVPSMAGLKSVLDLARDPWHEDHLAVLARTPGAPHLEDTWDIATLAVLRRHRRPGRIVSRSLMGVFAHATYASLGTGTPARYWVSMLDLHVLNLIQRTWNRPFQPWPGVGVGSYLDSPASLPVWTNTQEWIQRCGVEAPGLREQMLRPTRLAGKVAVPPTRSLLEPFTARYS
jgi:hypothetical protein